MINYNLARISKLKRPTTLPEISDRRSFYYAYLKILRTMLGRLNVTVAAELANYLLREQRQMGTDHAYVFAAQAASFSQALILDVDPSDFDSLDGLSRTLARMASASVKRILALESKVHTKTFVDTAKKTLGVDLNAVVRDEDLDAYIDAAATRNAALITDISTSTMNRIKAIITDAVINGKSVKETKEAIRNTFQASDKRAQLIARDQTAKLTSDLNKIRQQQAMIQKYIWRTSLDERVRPRHAALEGKEYEWDEPTGAESGLPPGQPIQCRCVAQAYLEPIK